MQERDHERSPRNCRTSARCLETMARHGSSEKTRRLQNRVFSRIRGLSDQRSSFHPTCSSSWRTKLVTATAHDTSKAAFALCVSCHSIYTPSINGQTHLLDSIHPCLNVDEILRLIIHELVASREKAKAIGSACCCKGFEDPVLDALWTTQDRLLPLLKSFPGGVWNNGGCIVSATTWSYFSLLNDSKQKTFRRFPTTMEWARFRKYARRMQEFGKMTT